MPLAAADIEFLRGVVAERSGHVISSEQGYLFESRLRLLAEQEGHESVEAFVTQLRCAPSAGKTERIAEAMTINETFFFRDVHPFDALRDQIVPTLINSRKNLRRLNIWCAACSSGQEPYSVAITLREHFPELSSWNVKILATDLSDAVLDKARIGKFTQFEVNRGLPAKLLIKHFDRDGADWQIHQDVKRMIEFRKLNLATPWPLLPRCDVVFMRNVLIYFSAETKQSILRGLHRTLADDGYLLLGGGETLINLNSPFTREAIGSSVCYRPMK